jgi:RHS repeat-associated protein
VIKHVTYDAFGNVTSDTATGVKSLFLYTARPYDADTTLQNNLNRWYDLSIGRLVSEDPIGHKGGINLYAYVGNSPLKWADSTGLLVFNTAAPIPSAIQWQLTPTELAKLMAENLANTKAKYDKNVFKKSVGCSAYHFMESEHLPIVTIEVFTLEAPQQWTGDVTSTTHGELHAWLAEAGWAVETQYAVSGTLERKQFIKVENKRYRCCRYCKTRLSHFVLPSLFAKKCCRSWKNRYTYTNLGMKTGWTSLSFLVGNVAVHWTGGDVFGVGGYFEANDIPGDNL